MLKQPTFWIGMMLLCVLTIFALENMTVIEVSMLGFEFQTRRIVLIVTCVAIGFLLGKAIRFRRRKS